MYRVKLRLRYLSGVVYLGAGWDRKDEESESQKGMILKSELGHSFSILWVGGSALDFVQFFCSFSNLNKITT